MTRTNNHIGGKILECNLYSSFRNPVILILMFIPAILICSVTVFVVLNEYDSWTASGTVLSMFNPYQHFAYYISLIGKYIIPVVYMCVSAASDNINIQSAPPFQVLPCKHSTIVICNIFQNSLIVVVSICLANITFILCTNLIAFYMPMLDLSSYRTLFDFLTFFIRLGLVAILISITQTLAQLFCKSIWPPITIGLVLMTTNILPEGYNVYSDGLLWVWTGFNTGISLIKDILCLAKMVSVCILIIIGLMLWTRKK